MNQDEIRRKLSDYQVVLKRLITEASVSIERGFESLDRLAARDLRDLLDIMRNTKNLVAQYLEGVKEEAGVALKFLVKEIVTLLERLARLIDSMAESLRSEWSDKNYSKGVYEVDYDDEGDDDVDEFFTQTETASPFHAVAEMGRLSNKNLPHSRQGVYSKSDKHQLLEHHLNMTTQMYEDMVGQAKSHEEAEFYLDLADQHEVSAKSLRSWLSSGTDKAKGLLSKGLGKITGGAPTSSQSYALQRMQREKDEREAKNESKLAYFKDKIKFVNEDIKIRKKDLIYLTDTDASKTDINKAQKLVEEALRKKKELEKEIGRLELHVYDEEGPSQTSLNSKMGRRKPNALKAAKKFRDEE